MLSATFLEFPAGEIFLAKTHKGLSLALFVKNKQEIEKITESLKAKGHALLPDKTAFKEEKRLFDRYFRGEKEDFTTLNLDFISGTPYQKRVWREARKIPYGKTWTYKLLAHKLNHRGYRSVGQALARNPLLIVIPCHRVLRSDGSLGGFSAGLKVKKFLLALEGTFPKGTPFALCS